MHERVITGADGKRRCTWCGDDPLYVRYHDEEWGFPTADPIRLFEKISLEGFQSGLSWLTILRKRENLRKAFDRFDPRLVARYRARDVKRLLGDEGIVRHRGKIESTINNARRALELDSLPAYLWSWEGKEAAGLAKDLRKRGWTFVGPTTLFSFMQACGMRTTTRATVTLMKRSNALAAVSSAHDELRDRAAYGRCAH